MRVAAVNQPFNDFAPPDGGGSVASWIWQAARRLDPSFAVTVFAARRRGRPDRETIGGLDCLRLDAGGDRLRERLLNPLRGFFPDRRPLFASGWTHRGYGRSLARALGERKCDVAHLHNFIQLPAAVRRGAPGARIILHMHCDWLAQLDRALVERALDDVDLVVGCSEHVIGGARARFPSLAGRCVTVPNGFDPDLFSPGDDDEASADGPEILFVGRITPEKGLHDLVSAFSRVARVRPDARLRLVGPHWPSAAEYIVGPAQDPAVRALAPHFRGNYLSSLRGMVPADLRGRVTFAGRVPPRDLPGLYRNAAVLANPSLTEAFGMSLVEAAGCGTPVVATRVGGMPEVVRDGETGTLVPAADPVKLAATILDILDQPLQAARMAAAARADALARFTWNRVADELAAAYRKVAL